MEYILDFTIPDNDKHLKVEVCIFLPTRMVSIAE